MDSVDKYEKEKEMIAYCEIYCRLCDYYTGKIQSVIKAPLEVVERHPELKLLVSFFWT
mgnify:CR=1 FL=1